jgi:hypothetical protein
MNCVLVTVESKSMGEAADAMRSLGYVSTAELRWKAVGLTADHFMEFGISPALCRFRSTGKVLANAYYWTHEQEREIARASIAWIERELAADNAVA